MPSKALLWRQYSYFSKSQQSLDCHFCYLQDGVRFSIPGLLSVVTIIHRTAGMIFIKPHHSNGLKFCNSPSSISCGSDPRTDLRIMCFLELAHFDASLLCTHKHCISPAVEVSICYHDHPLALCARLQTTHTFHISIQNLFLIHLSEPT